MNSVNRLSPDFRQGPGQVSLCLPRERERREDAPASKDLLAEKHAEEFEHHKPALMGLRSPGGCRGELRASFPRSLKQALRAAFQQRAAR